MAQIKVMSCCFSREWSCWCFWGFRFSRVWLVLVPGLVQVKRKNEGAPYLRDRGQRSHFLRSGSSLASHFSLSMDSTLQMSLNATFKKFRIQCFPLLIKILATIHTNHRNMLKNSITLCPNCTTCCSISLTKMTKVYSIFKEGKKKLQRIQYQQPECGHWEATKWTLPSSGASVFVIIIFVIIFIMIISDFSM